MKPLSDIEIIKKFKLKSKDKILDVGGSMRQHTHIKIDTLVDIIRPEDAPYGPSPLTAKHFVKCDFTREKLPFKNKQFDFCLCTHTIEDLNNPVPLLEEISRVAKRGYITTPSMGKDMVFSPIDFTNWLTGARRVPGDSHHKWLVSKKGKKLVICPKNYPILYSGNFHFVDWSGDTETQYAWKGSVNFVEIKDLNIHELIDHYQSFVDKNTSKLKRAPIAFYLDTPFHYLKALVKLVLRRGKGFQFRRV